MDLITLSNFVWQAMANGVIGNATYAAVKKALRGSFGRLNTYVEQGQRAEFDNTLQILLEGNEAMLQELTRLAEGKSGDTYTQINEDIKANGNVTIVSGSNNRIND